jgi:hypothetical protein
MPKPDVARRIDAFVAPHPAAAITVVAILLAAVGAVHAGETRDAPVASDAPQRPTAPDPHPVGPVATGAAPRAEAPPPLDLSATVIRQAIIDSRDPVDDVVVPHGGAFGAGGPAGPPKIDAAFKQAQIPTCMTPEAYKFDPPQIGFVGLGGFLALPYLVHAIATGKCRH